MRATRRKRECALDCSHVRRGQSREPALDEEGAQIAADGARRWVRVDRRSHLSKLGGADGVAVSRMQEVLHGHSRSDATSATAERHPQDHGADTHPGNPRAARGWSVRPRVPWEITSFVGRRSELAQLRAVLAGTRMLTLIGPGGVGKTRLALRAAAMMQPRFAGGLALVELGGVEDAGLVARSVASALELRDDSGRWPVSLLAEHIAAREFLLILDNCEHLVDACAVLVDGLLHSCPALRILATSRQPLGIAGEATLLVPSLSVPPEDRRCRLGDVARTEAAQLFGERAAAAAPGFALTNANADTVAALCRRLDGIPLAIELAAVRLRVFSAEQILERLDQRLGLLTSGIRTAPVRQRTLRATIEWSHDLLASGEQVLFRRLAVFPAAFELDTATTICGGRGLAASDVLPTLAALVEKSMVARDGGRYRLLETLREYARERLRDAGEETTLLGAHRDWCAALSHRARGEWTGPDQAKWFDRMASVHADVRTALEFSLAEADRAETGLALAADLWLYWQARGHLGEGRRWLSALLDRLPRVRPRARGLWVAGFLALSQRDLDAAQPLLRNALALARRSEDAASAAFAHQYLGVVALFGGDLTRASNELTAAIRGHDRVGEPAGAFARADLALVTHLRGEHERASELFQASLDSSRRSGDGWTRSHALWGLGLLAADQGEPDRALELEREALALMAALDERTGIALRLEALAWIAGAADDVGRAARLLGAADAVWTSIPSCLPDPMRSRRDVCAKRARASLGHALFERLRRQGAAMSREEAIAYALKRRPVPRSNSLSPREDEVAQLLAAGLSDREIAAELVISIRTAQSHVSHILSKLRLRSRTQVAATWPPPAS